MSSPDRPGRGATVGGASLALLGLLVGLSACGSSRTAARPASSPTVAARHGDLEVIDPFLPDPASPSVAAVYLTVRNLGASPDELLSVSSPAAAQSMLMTEDEHGSVGSMAPLMELRIPAHGEAMLRPGHDHAMLEHPRAALRVGESVTLDLRFARGGTLVVRVPVVPLDRILQGLGEKGPGGTRPDAMEEM